MRGNVHLLEYNLLLAFITFNPARSTLASVLKARGSIIMATMRAIVIHESGGPEVLKLENRPILTPESGHVLIRIKAFGLNRSELFIRQGLSPSVLFPRILGIEASGLVESCPGGEFRNGEVVVTAMGGMGR